MLRKELLKNHLASLFNQVPSQSAGNIFWGRSPTGATEATFIHPQATTTSISAKELAARSIFFAS